MRSSLRSLPSSSSFTAAALTGTTAGVLPVTSVEAEAGLLVISPDPGGGGGVSCPQLRPASLNSPEDPQPASAVIKVSAAKTRTIRMDSHHSGSTRRRYATHNGWESNERGSPRQEHRQTRVKALFAFYACVGAAAAINSR